MELTIEGKEAVGSLSRMGKYRRIRGVPLQMDEASEKRKGIDVTDCLDCEQLLVLHDGKWLHVIYKAVYPKMKRCHGTVNPDLETIERTW